MFFTFAVWQAPTCTNIKGDSKETLEIAYLTHTPQNKQISKYSSESSCLMEYGINMQTYLKRLIGDDITSFTVYLMPGMETQESICTYVLD